MLVFTEPLTHIYKPNKEVKIEGEKSIKRYFISRHMSLTHSCVTPDIFPLRGSWANRQLRIDELWVRSPSNFFPQTGTHLRIKSGIINNESRTNINGMFLAKLLWMALRRLGEAIHLPCYSWLLPG